MITTGIERILISVRDMDESLAFYRDEVGMQVVADQNLDPAKIQQLWNLSKGTKARAVFLKNEEQSTLLELIEFKPHSGRAIREGAQIRDYGIYDIALLVKDLDKTHRDLIGKGFKFISPPIRWVPRASFVPFDSSEAILNGPNDMPIALMELWGEGHPEVKKGNYGMIVDSAQMVEDIEEVIRFYRDILGLTLQGDHKLPRGQVDELLKLPPGTDVRIAFFNKEGFFNKEVSSGPLVECISYSIKAKSLAAVAKPPNLGVFMIAFETDDLSGLMEKFKEEKIKVLSGPVEMESGPHGKINTIIGEGPSKVMVEFFEKQ